MFQNIILATYRPGPTGMDGYYKLQAVKNDFKIFVSELMIRGSIAKYSYTLLHKEEIILRYDNAPHHPRIETFPHHKHWRDEVMPIYDRSIDSFLEEAASLMEGPGRGR
ncbi:MAG: DUF6516 family protein [Desulfurococcales archaeon]|nr:DUF6516 family protein [Desulfurococcales archaeon]